MLCTKQVVCAEGKVCFTRWRYHRSNKGLRKQRGRVQNRSVHHRVSFFFRPTQIKEVAPAIALYRSAKRSTVVSELNRCAYQGERVTRVKPLVVKVEIKFAMQVVGRGLGCDLHALLPRFGKLRRKRVGADANALNRLFARQPAGFTQAIDVNRRGSCT